MIADVLSVSGGPIWLPMAITIAAIMAFMGIVIRVMRIKKAELEAMSRLVLDDNPPSGDLPGAQHGKI